MKIYRFNEFDAIDESLPNKNTIDQLKMVRKLSKGTDIGDRISDMNREGENLHYMHNAIDNGIESSRILRNQIKTLCHHGMLKMWIHLVRNIKNKRRI
jgi:hypothetical protein